MLQNPSKFHHTHAHQHPLSHFLALHNTQAAAIAASAAAAVQNASLHGHIGGGVVPHAASDIVANQHMQAQQQQQQSTTPHVSHLHPPQHHQQSQPQQHHQQQQQQQPHNHNHPTHPIHMPAGRTSVYSAQLLDAAAAAAAAHTSLEQMGSKSFTIAAILGLQKGNDYNSAINLSISGSAGGGGGGGHVGDPQVTIRAATSDIDDEDNCSGSDHLYCTNNSNNNNNNNNICSNNNNNNNSINQLKNCDNINTPTSAAAAVAAVNLVNRYLPPISNGADGGGGGGGGVGAASTASFQQHCTSQAQPPPMPPMSSLPLPPLPTPGSLPAPPPTAFGAVSHRNFAVVAAAAAAAAAANGNNAPSALQSLQQLHRQHAHQQNALTFPRGDKLKPDGGSGSKKSSLKNKRVRTIFTPEQLERLEAEFERQQYMVGPERLYLAHTLQLTEAQVKVWFQNRRIKWRKHHLELTQQRLALLRQTTTHLPPPTENTSTNVGAVSCNEEAGASTMQHASTSLSSSSPSAISCGGIDDVDHMVLDAGGSGEGGGGEYDDAAQPDSCNVSRHASESSNLSICNDSDDEEATAGFMEATEETT